MAAWYLAARLKHNILFVFSSPAMTQKNLRYKTERKVCRRPKFVSQSEVERIRKR